MTASAHTNNKILHYQTRKKAIQTHTLLVLLTVLPKLCETYNFKFQCWLLKDFFKKKKIMAKRPLKKEVKNSARLLVYWKRSNFCFITPLKLKPRQKFLASLLLFLPNNHNWLAGIRHYLKHEATDMNFSVIEPLHRHNQLSSTLIVSTTLLLCITQLSVTS